MSNSIVSYEDDKVHIKDYTFNRSRVENICEKIIHNDYNEKEKFDKYNIEYQSEAHRLVLIAHPRRVGDKSAGVDWVKAYLWNDSFQSEVKLKEDALRELLGDISYSIFLKNIKDYIVSIDIYNDGEDIVFKNEFYDVSFTVSEEFLKNSIISIISDSGEDSKYTRLDTRLSYFRVKLIDIGDNKNSSCYQCGNKNCNNAISLITSYSPLFICCQCYEDFLTEYTSCTRKEFITSII